MTELTEMTCEACRFDAPKATEQERKEFSQQIPDWEVVTVDGVERLKRQFKLKNYAQSVKFTNCIAELAEAEDHHPLIVLEWGKVTVEWWTHKIKGLHRNDFISAAKTDKLVPSDED
jgi:4a-hydroxytetrahydrobiopterin dehydratase